jgi:cytoskeletal protein CcmA (bactofilin family)
MGALALMVALPPSAGAAELRHGDPNYSLPAGEVIHTDLIVTADSTRIDGDVEGDLITFSHSVTVNGHIKGDIIAFSQELRVNGPVDGNVRAMAQNLQLYGKVARNVLVWAGDVNLDQDAVVNGSLTAGSGHLEVNGKLVGDLLAFSGDVDINGQLGRNARIRAGHLTIGSRADIAGQTNAELRQAPEVSTSAKLGSPLDWKITQRDSENRYSSARYYVHQILKWGASFLFGLVLLFLMPGFFFDAVRACNKTAPAIGFGLLLLPGVLLAAVIMCITIVGLGVGISALLLWLIAIYAAQVLVGAWLGEKVLGASAGVGAALGRLALGLAILRVLGMLPYLGWWISFVAVIWGIGAVALASYKNMRPQVAAAVAAV